jgi:hypothetical protein
LNRKLFLKTVLLGMLSLHGVSPLRAAIGDNALPIPSTYNISHPRLGAPPNSWLIRLWNGGALLSRYASAAGTTNTGFDPTCSRQNCDGVGFRYLLTSYLASKAGGNPNVTWENKLFTLAGLGGPWGQVMISGNTCLSGQFWLHPDLYHHGCRCQLPDGLQWWNLRGVSDCAGLALCGEYDYRFSRRSDRAFSSGQPYPLPNGTGPNIIVLNTLMDTGETAYYQAMLYDWVYSDFTAQQRSNVQTSLANLCLQFENDFVNSQYSSDNDEFYAGGGMTRLKEIRSSCK